MSEDERVEKVQRLVTAHKVTREALESRPVALDVHAGIEIASKWTVITAAYSGLEQTLKYLIAEEKGQTIAELLAARQKKRSPYQTHDLGKLFRALQKRTQNVVREFYGRFQSLHCYISVETVDEFLKIVSDDDGRGYERWRYTLIEEKPLPKNSSEALVAIWGVCVEIAEEELWGNERVWMPNRTLQWELGHRLDDVVLEVSVDRQNQGEPFQDITDEVREWAWKTGHPLNAFADVLWHVKRYGEHCQPGNIDLAVGCADEVGPCPS